MVIVSDVPPSSGVVPSGVSEVTAAPEKMPSTASHSPATRSVEPRVSTVNVPPAGQVHLNQTVLVADVAGTGSPVWKVASVLLVPVWMPELPERTIALAKSSLAGGAARAVPASRKLPVTIAQEEYLIAVWAWLKMLEKLSGFIGIFGGFYFFG